MASAVPLPPQPPPPPAAIPAVESSSALQASAYSSWGAGLVSAVVHLSLVLSLAIFVVAQRSPRLLGYLEVGVKTDRPALAELVEATLEMPPLENQTWQPAESAAVATQEADLLAIDPPSAEFASLEAGIGPRGPLGDVAELAQDVANEKGQLAEGGAEFYGIRAAGERFVYVVDCSSSMEGRKWQAARHELLASLRRLGDYRQFFVILFDGTAHPMFGDETRFVGMLPATEGNVLRLETWINDVQLGNDTSPFAAVRQAVELRPHAIFLLTDGEFVDPTANYLQRHNIRREKGKRVPQVTVHTVGFFTRKSQELLKRIARDNAGVFRFVNEAPN